MYFLATGMTWYESIISGLQPLDSIDKIPIWREKARTNRWSDVAHELSRIGVDIQISIPTDINPMEIGSAMKVFSSIKYARTDFFAKYEDELLNASSIGNLYAKTWTIEL
jgi:hypothetical protein